MRPLVTTGILKIDVFFNPREGWHGPTKLQVEGRTGSTNSVGLSNSKLVRRSSFELRRTRFATEFDGVRTNSDEPISSSSNIRRSPNWFEGVRIYFRTPSLNFRTHEPNFEFTANSSRFDGVRSKFVRTPSNFKCQISSSKYFVKTWVD